MHQATTDQQLTDHWLTESVSQAEAFSARSKLFPEVYLEDGYLRQTTCKTRIDRARTQ